MLNHIETLLYEKTKDSQSKILYAQWNYDKKVIPDILRSISNLFPHYSLHDESHSISIINNIVRILGKDNLEKLSAIDLWLILEASYSHDIGMAVSANEIKNTLDSDKFIAFFRNILRDKKHTLYEFASQFKIDDNRIEYKSPNLNLELHDGIKFILAEYYRSSHSNRSKDIITGENKEFNMSHFGAIIPKRIFKILGSICDSHTQNFDEVMKLSFSEVGIDTEDAHPRFIACMLRIGDLLDLDNHRFSDVMLRTLHKIPLETLKHKDKHMSIESFRVDRKIINITAKCKEYDIYDITQHWFSYLRSEVTNQMINWNKIVPSKEFGYLPTIGALRVELDKYELINEKEKPQFKVDTDKALTLLQGAGIYEDAYQSIREILQNAVDATLIRIWLEHKNTKNFETPTSKDFLKLLSNYSITINIKEKKTKKKKKIWQIKIEDCGIGISKDDLKFLINTGSSSRNRRKRDIIEEMPIWMKPSGTFGIGFQSIFMLTKQVVIGSKSFFDEQFHIIELNSPSSKRNGTVLVEQQDSDYSKKIGSKINFEYKTDKIPNKYSHGKNNTLSKKVIDSFDPISDNSFDIQIAHIIDKISNFNTKSYLPIKLFFQNNLIMDIKTKDFKKFHYFSKNNALEISLYDNKDIQGSWLPTVYYKGQHIEKSNLWGMKFLPFDINILGDNASKVLTIDRNKIRTEYNKTLNKKILNTLYEYLTKDYDDLTKEKNDKIIIDCFLNFYFLDKLKKDNKVYDGWINHKVKFINNKTKELGKLLEEIDILIFISKQTPINDSFKKDEYILKKKKLEIIIYGRGNNTTDFIKKITPRYFNSIILNESKNQIRVLKQGQKSPIKFKEIKSFLIKHKNFSYGTRVTIPCYKKYNNLRLKDNAYIPWLWNIYSTSINLPIPFMLSPYFCIENNENKKLEYRVNNKLIDWVYKNRYNETTTKEEIKTTYEQFRENINIDEINNATNN
jgi:hypothetical protein